MEAKLEKELSPQCHFFTYTEEPQLEPIFQVKQVHGNSVVDFHETHEGNREADGIFLLYQDIQSPHYLAIKTADCLPVAVIGEKGDRKSVV